MAGTTAASFKGSLRSVLAAALPGVQVEYADPGKWSRRERVWLGEVEDGEHEPTGFRQGRRRREETYVVRVHVEVIGSAKDAQGNEERAVAIVTAVEEAVADDPTAGNPAVAFAVVSGFSMSTTHTTDGPRTTADVSVAVKARLL